MADILGYALPCGRVRGDPGPGLSKLAARRRRRRPGLIDVLEQSLASSAEARWHAGRVTTSPQSDPAGRPDPTAVHEARVTSETTLIIGAKRWIREALDAWIEDDQAKVALMAPMAVELLGKATLWRDNPVLLVQLNDRHELSLFLLATRPDLATKGVRTIGLQIVMNRLIKLLGDLPVAKDRREHIVDARNGAVHVGVGEQSRFILLDCLAVVGVLLERLGIERKDSMGRTSLRSMRFSMSASQRSPAKSQ